MKAEDLEAAWGTHTCSDVSVKDSLVLELTRLDPARWEPLQNAARAEPSARKHADALASFAGKVRSPLVRERMIGRAYQSAGAHDEAVRWCAEALAVTPRWDPVQVPATCNTMAWSLYLSGDLAGARAWAERGLAIDPTHPFLLGTYCETLGKLDPTRAAAVHRFLKNAGFSASTWGDYQPSRELATTPALTIDLDLLPKRTLDDVHRFVISKEFDHNATPQDRDHGAALLLRGAGYHAPALLAARLAMESAAGDLRVQSKVLFDALADEVPPAVRDAVLAAKGRYSKDPEKRAAAVKKLCAAKDAAALRDLVLDPHYGVSMAGCEGLVTLDAAKDLAPYLAAATAMEHATGQSICQGAFPKPFDLESGARIAKPSAKGADLVASVIELVKKGGKKVEISIPAPEPIPPEVLEQLELADGVKPSAAMKAWLAFDAAWLAREYDWLDDPANPAFTARPVHVIVADLLSDVFAQAFVDLPGKLAGALALPLDQGSDSMRMLALVPGPDGEYPVIFVDTDDMPMVGIEAPSFDVWLASTAGLVGDMGRKYETEIARVAKYFFGGKAPYESLELEGVVDDYEARLATDRDAARAMAERLRRARGNGGPAGKGKATKAKPVVVPALPEPKLGEAIAQAIAGGRADRAAAFLAAAEERYPKGKQWRDRALVAAVHADDAELVGRLLAGGADANTKSYLQNTVVHAAAKSKDARILSLLLAAGGDHAKRGYSGQTPLFDACDDGCLVSVKALLAAGADPNLRDENKRTPLMTAAETSTPESAALAVNIAAALLDGGADPSANSGQMTALHEAIERRNAPLAGLLIDRGADIEATNWDGKNALHAAWSAGDLVTFDRLAATGRRDRKRKNGPTLDDLIQGDGVVPARFDVRVQCQEAPQEVTLRLRFERTPHLAMQDHALDNAARSLLDMAEAGLLGSDVFPPSSGVGQPVIATTTSGTKSAKKAVKGKTKPGAIRAATGTFEERELVFRLGGVSPAGLAFWLRGMRASPVTSLAGLELVGAFPLSGAHAFDTARAERALRDPASEPLMPSPGTSMVVDSPARELVARVKARPRAKGLAAFDAGVSAAMGLVRPRSPGDIRERFRSAPLRLTAFPQVKGEAHEFAHLRFGAGPDLSLLDLTTAKRLFQAGVARLATAGQLVSAEWCLGVTGVTRS